jgi:hypothetical protein
MAGFDRVDRQLQSPLIIELNCQKAVLNASHVYASAMRAVFLRHCGHKHLAKKNIYTNFQTFSKLGMLE